VGNVSFSVEDLFSRWASVGVFVLGEIHPYEDPEVLLVDTLVNIESEGRFLGIIVSWLAQCGHLLLTKKLRFPTTRERRLFAAIIEESRTKERKLLRMVQKHRTRDVEYLYRNDLDVLRRVAKTDPNPRFLKHGFILKDFALLRPEKIILPPTGVYERSAILRNRALYGVSLRSDLLTILPEASGQSVRQLAHRLHVAPPTLSRIVADYERSGLVEWTRKGPVSSVRWCGPTLSKAA